MLSQAGIAASMPLGATPLCPVEESPSVSGLPAPLMSISSQ